ncbi:MAG: biopolymer transporter ExbD [Bdellovibrionaceae bacterium]|nr:biopolymer transporter ExbD [Pseudobdellovibrionaceae bacterium]
MASTETTTSGSKQMTFDLNLVPFIDILSTCICFLLMTTIWVQIGVFNVSQAIGSEPPAGGKNPPSVIVEMKNSGLVEISLKDVEGMNKPQAQDISPGATGDVNWLAVETSIDSIGARVPNIKTVLVMPSAKTKYDDVIRMMDLLKKRKLDQIGIAPLAGS